MALNTTFIDEGLTLTTSDLDWYTANSANMLTSIARRRPALVLAFNLTAVVPPVATPRVPSSVRTGQPASAAMAGDGIPQVLLDRFRY